MPSDRDATRPVRTTKTTPAAPVPAALVDATRSTLAPLPPPRVHGVGPFLASRDMTEDARTIRKKLEDCAATWCPILVESIDGRRQRTERIRDLAIELREHEIVPWLYSFPHPKRALASADHLLEVAHDVRIPRSHLCLDIEPAGPDAGDDWTERGIADVYAAVSDRTTREARPTITLFTRAEWDRFNWDQIAPDAEIWLQVYERVADVARLVRAIARWAVRFVPGAASTMRGTADAIGTVAELAAGIARAPWRRVVALFGSYLGGIDRLERDLKNLAAYAKLSGAAGLWALATSDRAERMVMRNWALATWAAPAASSGR